MKQINRVSVIIFIAIAALLSSCESEKNMQKDDKIYQILISDKSVASSNSYSSDWMNSVGSKMHKAQLFQCENPGYLYGHVTIAEWDDFKALKKAYNKEGKPEDKLHRAYKKVGSTASEAKAGDFYVVTVFDFPKEVLGKDDLKPNWNMFSKWMKDKPGFVNAELYESISPDVTYRYINVANWNSLTDLYKIIGDESNLFNETIANSAKHSKAQSNIYKIAKKK